MTSRNKPGLAFWATVVVVVGMVGYVLGFGPVLAYYRSGMSTRSFQPLVRAYRPLLWLRNHGPEPIPSALEGYVEYCERLF